MRSMRRVLLTSMLVTAMAWGQAQGKALSLPQLADRLDESLRKIGTMAVEVEVYLPLTGPDDPGKMFVARWLHTSGEKECFSTTCSYKTQDPQAPFTAKVAYNGELLRAIAYSAETGQPILGNLHATDKRSVDEKLRTTAQENSVFLRCAGIRMMGQPVSAWLRDPNARLADSEEWGGELCQVVEIPATDRATSTQKEPDNNRLYFSPAHNYALLRMETIRDGQRVYEQTAEGLREVIPGIWLPTQGSVAVTISGPARATASGPTRFRVRSIAVNEPIAPEEFNIDFPDGLTVMDARMGKLVRTRWVQGTPVADVKTSDLGALAPVQPQSLSGTSEAGDAGEHDVEDAQAKEHRPLEESPIDRTWLFLGCLAAAALALASAMWALGYPRRRKRFSTGEQ